jgi:succinoglycan biosynthesis transport protein ExoP
MAQYEMNLRDAWLIVRRRRFIVLASTVLVTVLSLWFARQKVPVYEATAAVKYEQSTALSGLLVEVLSYSSADSIETQATLIRSYPILEEVARRLGRLPPAGGAPGERESAAYPAVLNALAARIKTTRVPNTSILEITATAHSPREARDLANTVAEAYRDYNRNVRNARITEARKFIEAQLKEVEARVRRAEEQVWAFREANRIIAPGAESAVLVSLFTQLRGEIEKTRQQRTELELAQQRLARAEGPSPADRVFVESTNPALQRLQATQVELLLERNNLALEVTDRHPRLQAIEDRLREVRAEMRREVAAQIALLRSREEILNRQMGELLQKNRELPAIELGLARLQRDAKLNDDLLTLLKTRHQEALIKESESIEEVTIVRPATEPAAPVGGETLNTVLVGALLGLMLGLVLAFVQETLDTSIGTIEDVESYLQVPVLGIVPHIDTRETMARLIERRPALAEMDPEALQSHALLITHFDPKSPVAEAYRTLRTNIQFMRLERQGKVLVFTSPTLQEGKTTTIVNLAITMAQNGQRTLLVGANLRRPSIHRFFGIEREPGLSDVLVGNARWRECIRTVADILMGRFEMEDIMVAPGLDNLHIIEAGPIPANPSELLSTPAMAQFLREAREEYDIVLIDTPPVLPVTDSAIVAAQADGVVLVYQAGKVGRLVLKRAKAHLESARARVWGVVLNDVQTEIAGYAYTHYYTHYYGEEAPEAEGPGRLGRLWAAVRARLAAVRRARPGPPAAATPARPVRPAPAARPSPPRRRRLGLAVLVLILVLAAVLAAAVWSAGWLSVNVRSLLGPHSRLLSPPALSGVSNPAVAPPVDAAPREPPPAVAVAPSGPGAGAGESAPGEAGAPPSAAAASGAPRREGAREPGAPDERAPAQERVASVEPATPAGGATGRPRVEPVQRFAVEFGPFATAAEAERVERALSEAGHPTVRFRRRSGGNLFAVVVERLPARRDAEQLAAALAEQGLGEAAVVGSDDAPAVRVGEPLPLRAAVQLAEQLRARGHLVRLAAQPGEAAAFIVRHGNFDSRREAEERAADLARLGFPNHVVRVR